MKILMIGDDAQTAALIATGSQEHGHRVELAASGRGGLLLAAGESYDLMVANAPGTRRAIYRQTGAKCRRRDAGAVCDGPSTW